MNDFANWYTEIHPTKTGMEVTRKIATHLAIRIMTGNAIIVCDKPRTMLSAYRKKWMRILRLLENQRAATQSKVIKAELLEYSVTLEGTRFVVDEPQERSAPTVWLLEPDTLDKIPQGVTTVYVASEITRPQLLYWTRQLGDSGVLLLFRRQPLPAATSNDGLDTRNV